MDDRETLELRVGHQPSRRQGLGQEEMLHLWARSIRGKVRQVNQDAWCVATPEGTWWGPSEGGGPAPDATRGLLAVGVFDGLGGHANGREAAWAAAQALPGAIDRGQGLREVVAHLQDAVVSSGGLTTALVAVLPEDSDEVRLLSVGDSAAFAWGEEGQGLKRVNELDRAGRHELSDCLGDMPGRSGEPGGHEVQLPLGRGFVLTTDGVADEVPFEREWGELLGDPVARAGKRFHRLFEAVEQRGAPDNATTILVRSSRSL